jgi:hypothetical protein
MIWRGEGRIVWVSSREGLNTNRFTGIYSASKHAVEHMRTMSLELREFSIKVARVNPGPFLTRFNDRGSDTWRGWEDDEAARLYDYSKLTFPRSQFDPDPGYATLIAVAAGEVDSYRNLEPKSMISETKGNIEAPWSKKIRDGLGTRPDQIQGSYDMEPETHWNPRRTGRTKCGLADTYGRLRSPGTSIAVLLVRNSTSGWEGRRVNDHRQHH